MKRRLTLFAVILFTLHSIATADPCVMVLDDSDIFETLYCDDDTCGGGYETEYFYECSSGTDCAPDICTYNFTETTLVLVGVIQSVDPIWCDAPDDTECVLAPEENWTYQMVWDEAHWTCSCTES